MYDIVRGDSAVKNGKASITARLGCQGRCVCGVGGTFWGGGGGGGGGELQGYYDMENVLDQAAAGISMFLVLAIRFVKIKSQS